MIKIAFCDDEISILKEMSAILDAYRLERNCEIEYTAYQSPFELMSDVERGFAWDILFLDIKMPGENGMEVARELRTFDNNVKIIFLTSHPEYAVESYTVGAFFYQLKPIRKDAIFIILDQAIGACQKVQNKKIVMKCKTGITAIAPEQLEYCEVLGHSLLLHMRDGNVLESVGKLNDLEEKITSFGGFLRAHRSYLVNMEYIQSISYKAIMLACQIEIPIPHGKYNDLKNSYLAYMDKKE